MNLWAISDLHLPGGSPRRRQRMEVHFGWGDYINRMARTWDALVRPDDLVLIPGDISWASTATRVREDLRWLAGRPGLKVVGRGNHYKWWYRWQENPPDGVNLMEGFGVFNGVGVVMLCGSPVSGSQDWTSEAEEEYQDQVAALKSALQAATVRGFVPVVALHWPPMLGNGASGYSELLEKYRVPLCLYGHLHGEQGKLGPVWRVRGVRYQLVAADNVVFAPMPLAY